MSKLLSISCPACGAGLKLKNNSFVGKKVPCPKCKKPFVVEEPEDDLAEDFEDDFESMEEEDDFEPPAPKSKSKGGGKGSSAKSGKGKKKSKGGNGGQIALLAGGGVLGLGLIGGLIYGAMALIGSGGGGGNSWVKWLPEETDVAVQVRVADSINAPVFKPITDHPTLSKLINQPMLPTEGNADPVSVLTQVIGIQAKDIDTITLGAVDGLGVIEANNSGGGRAFSKFVGVVRTKVPFDPAKLDTAPATALVKGTHGSQTIYSVVGATNPAVVLCAVDGSTILLGSDTELKAALDGGGKAPAASRYSFADDKASLVFVAAPKDESRLKALGITTLKKSLSGGTQDTGATSGIHGVSYTVTFSNDIRVDMRSSLDSSMAQSSADQMKKEIDAARPQLQAQLDQMGGFNPFVPADKLKKIIGHVDQMLGSSTATSSGSTANLTMTLSGQVVTDALDLAGPLMPMLEAELAKRPTITPSQSAGMPGMGMPGMPMMSGPPSGSGSPGVTSYPGMVINAGEQVKDKAGNMADQHNADLQAQMSGPPGTPSSTGAMPALAPPGGPSATGNTATGNAMSNMPALSPPGTPSGADGADGATPANATMSPEMMERMMRERESAKGGNPAGAGQMNATMSPEMMERMQRERESAKGGNPAGAGQMNATMSPEMMERMQREREGANGGAAQANMPNMQRNGAGQPDSKSSEENKPAPRSRSRRRSSK